MLEQFSATIDKIYAAAADHGRWEEALTAIEDITGSAGAVVHVVPRNARAQFKNFLGSSAANHFPRDDVEEWTAEYTAICPRLAAGARWPDAPYICDYMILSEREMDLDPVYQWYTRHGTRYFIGSPLVQTDTVQVVWSLQRTPGQGHVQEPEVRMFELLKPHLARAMTLADQLGTLRSYQGFSSAILESLPQSVFALDDQGSILFANQAARELLAAGDGIRMDAGRLRAVTSPDQVRLDAIIRSALLPLQTRPRGWARVSRPSGGPPLAVFVAPLNVTDEELTAAGAKVLVLVYDTAQHRCASVEMLTSVYGLTETEARLASALTGGHNLESAAAVLGMQPATARHHLKAIFRKVGVGRQQDLVALLSLLSIFERRN